MALLTEEKNQTKPSLWNQALKAVKGDATSELVEQFTQEMTLVAEGLCEDQARLRKAVDGLMHETEGQRSKAEQEARELERLLNELEQDTHRRLDEQEKENKRRLEEITRRIAALEKPAPKPKSGPFGLGTDVISRLTVLAGLVCGTWLIVTILNLLM